MFTYIIMYSVIYLKVSSIIVCPIKGQVRKECASHPSCHQACNSTGPVACPRICIVNGCECPTGTVIDWDKNECVYPRQCKGKYVHMCAI